MHTSKNAVLQTVSKEVNETELNKFEFEYDTVCIVGMILIKVCMYYFAR
jgi:hypothetical protein